MASTKDHKKFYGPPNPAYEIVKHIIDIDNEPEDVNTTLWNIYKVPCNLRSLNESAYTPQLFSIGPLHYGQEKLNPMQKQKVRYLNLFRDRAKKNMNNFKKYLKDKEDDIRHCYAEISYDINEEKLVDMMLLDSVFIMELILRIQSQKPDEEESKNNHVKKQTYLDDITIKQSRLIQRDLLLLENQIPLFILKKLYTFVPDSDPDMRRPKFIELAFDFFDSYHTYKKADSCSDQETAASSSSNGNSSKDNNTTSASGFKKKSSSRFKKLKENWRENYEPQHFTDLIRSFYVCKLHIPREKGSRLTRATELQEAGVNIEKVINRPLFDISFSRITILGSCMPNFIRKAARLEIPELIINSTTEGVLSNIMALERCHYPNQPLVCDYVSLLDYLMQTKEDVALLVEKEVIVHELRSDMQVQTLVRDLCRNVDTNITFYKHMIDELNDFNKLMSMWKWWNRSMRQLGLVYFRDLWRASSSIVGVVVFLFTLLSIYQTIIKN